MSADPHASGPDPTPRLPAVPAPASADPPPAAIASDSGGALNLVLVELRRLERRVAALEARPGGVAEGIGPAQETASNHDDLPRPRAVPPPLPGTFRGHRAAPSGLPNTGTGEPVVLPMAQAVKTGAERSGAGAMSEVMPNWSSARGSSSAGVLPPRRQRSARSLEASIGKNWASWVGGVVLLLGISFFLKYAWDQGWIRPSPVGRVAAAFLVGLAAGLAGEWVHRKRYRALAASLSGTGIAIVIATCFAGHAYFRPPVLGTTTASVLVLATAAAGVALALRADVMSLAILSLLGAYISPAILRTGQDRSLQLLLYLLVLATAGLTLSHLRGVRAVPIARRRVTTGGPSDGFADPRAWGPLRWFVLFASACWFALWWGSYGSNGEHRSLAIVWVSIVYALCVIEPLGTVYRVLDKLGMSDTDRADLPTRVSRPSLESTFAVDSNAAVFGVWATGLAFAAYYLIFKGDPHKLLGSIAIGIAFVQVGVALVTNSRRLIWSALLQAGAMVTIAVPLYLDQFSITIAWLAMAGASAVVGWLVNARSARGWAVVLLGLSIVRLALIDSGNGALSAALFSVGMQPVTRWLLLAWGVAVLCHVVGWLGPAPVRWKGAEGWLSARYSRTHVFAECAAEAASAGRMAAEPKQVLEYAAPDDLDAVQRANDPVGTGIALVGTAVFLIASASVWSGPMMTLLALGWLVPVLALARHGRHIGYRWQAVFLLVLIALRWLILDNLAPLSRAWDRPARDTAMPVLNLAVLAGVILGVAARLLRRQVGATVRFPWMSQPTSAPADAPWAQGVTAVGLGLITFAMLNFETWRAVDFLANRGADIRDVAIVKQVAMSVLWAVLGFSAVILGFASRIAVLRYVALILLAVTLVKILLVDMADVDKVWRILSFMGVGGLLLAVSYVYHKHLRDVLVESVSTEAECAGSQPKAEDAGRSSSSASSA